MWKLKQVIIILAIISSHSSYGAGGPAGIIESAAQIKKSFICPICSKSFLHKGHLNDHMRIHTSEKPYHCTYTNCDKNFVQKSHLDTHKRTHTGERPHTCSECGTSFSIKSYLTIHMRAHTGEKPYHCSECDKGFMTKSNLNRHTQVCKSMRLQQRDETDSAEEFQNPDALEEYLESMDVKREALLAFGPDVFNETGAAASTAKASAAK